ncbi:MAG: hypothetical protein ACMXYE_03070 [Candidatus Woesearchaeota archaeon]
MPSKKRQNRKEIQEEILSELAEIRRNEEDIKKKELRLLTKLDIVTKKDDFQRHKLFYEVAHFSYTDFSQIMIGCAVFSLPALINVSFWEFLPEMTTILMFFVHLFFLACVILALNFEYRNKIDSNKWFAIMLMKRFFYTYFSTAMIIILMLIMVGKISYALPNIDVFRHFLAAQSVGIFGAVTFSLLKR